MPLKPFVVPSFDVHQNTMIEIAKIQNDALMEIVCCEVSLDGGIAQRHIAEQALVEVFKLTQKLENQIQQN